MDDFEPVQATGVDLEGLLVVLGRNLYSTPAVAIRELVQNAHDSITRRRVEHGPCEGRIHVRSDPSRDTLMIEDNGSGLTEHEIHEYLATLGRGYTRQLRSRDHGDGDGLIGEFGLGFLSAFVIADLVTLTTTSATEPNRTHRYRSMDGLRYAIDTVETEAVGTTVELHLAPEYCWLAEPATLRSVLQHYCVLLREPIVCDGELVNDMIPPWRDRAHDSEREARARRMVFARRFDPRFEPLCTIDVEPLFGSDVRGLLWIQDGQTYGSSDNRHLTVFVRAMLLDDDAKRLLPRWAGFVSGVIESDHLTPTASRESLQWDEAHTQAAELLEITLIDGLAEIFRNEPETWRRIVARHNQALLSASLCDDRLFALLSSQLTVPTTAGEMTAQQLLLRGRGAVHVAPEHGSGFEAILYRSMGVPIARGDLHAVGAYLTRWCDDRGAELVVLGSESGNHSLFQPAQLSTVDHAWLAAELGDDDLETVAARFKPTSLPFIVVPDRQALLKRRIESDEADAQISGTYLHLARMHTAAFDDSVLGQVYVNLDSPPIAAALHAHRLGRPNADSALRILASVRRLLTGDLEARDTENQESTDAALQALGASIIALLSEGDQ